MAEPNHPNPSEYYKRQKEIVRLWLASDGSQSLEEFAASPSEVEDTDS